MKFQSASSMNYVETPKSQNLLEVNLAEIK